MGMLVLTRTPGQEIFVGDDIRLTVVSVRGNQVHIGFDAPANIPIWRGELHAPSKESPASAGAKRRERR